MVTSAVWCDYDGDRWLDLIVASQWQPVRVFVNRQGSKLDDATAAAGLDALRGQWNGIAAADLDADGASQFAYPIKQFLGVLDGTEWTTVAVDAYHDVAELLAVVERHKPDLVVTYRHLRSDAWKWPFSLGEYLDVLTQARNVGLVAKSNLILGMGETRDEVEQALGDLVEAGCDRAWARTQSLWWHS